MQSEQSLHANRWCLGLVLTAALVAVALVAPLSAQASRAATASLSGTAEVPALETTASGSFTSTFTGGELSFRLTSDAVGITQAHIHLGAVDENGGPVAFLFGAVDPGVNGIDVNGTITAADLIGVVQGDMMAFAQALVAGNGYVNVHTEANPAGEVRGQIAVGEVMAGVPGLPATGSGGLASTSRRGFSSLAAAGIGAAALLVALGGVHIASLGGRRVLRGKR